MKSLAAAVLLLSACFLTACGGAANSTAPAAPGLRSYPSLAGAPPELAPRRVQAAEQHTFTAPDMLDCAGASFSETTLLRLDAGGLSYGVLGVDVAPGQRPYKLLLEGLSDGVYVALSDYGRSCWRWLDQVYTDTCAINLPAGELVSDMGSFCVVLACADGAAADLQATVFLTDETGGDGLWNVMIWMAGDNYMAEQAYQNIQALESVGSTDSVNVLLGYDIDPVQLDGQYAGVTQAHYIKVVPDSNPEGINTGGDPANQHFNREGFNSADPLRLVEFLDWAEASFPAAEHSMLILFGPADGWRADPGG